MADPGAKAIMIGRIAYGYFRAHLFRAVDKFSALSGVNVLAGKRREKPRGAFEKISVGELHAGIFLPRHGMPGEESLAGVSPERFGRALDNLHLRAADIGDECLRQQRWSNSLNQI